jgi:hypothetical protein
MKDASVVCVCVFLVKLTRKKKKPKAAENFLNFFPPPLSPDGHATPPLGSGRNIAEVRFLLMHL